MDKTKQQMRFSDTELSLIKNTFSDNEDLLKAIRKVFLQIELSKKEKELIDSLSNKKEVIAVIKKTFLPEIDGDAPLNQVIDLWMTLDIKGRDVDAVYHDSLARNKLIKYLEDSIKSIERVLKTPEIDFKNLSKVEDKDALSVYINLTVRNTVIAHVEMQLQQLSVLAGLKEETVEETKERLFKNSAK